MRSYLAGAVAARTGDEMSGTALLLAGLAATGSASDAAALLAALTVAAVVGGPVLGGCLDAVTRPGRLLGGALAVHAVALGCLLASLGRVPLLVSLLVALLAGLPGAALSGGWTAQLRNVASRERLSRVTAFDAMTYHLAGLAGPALAGIVAGVWGASASVVVAVALVALALPAAFALPAARALPPACAPPPAEGAVRQVSGVFGGLVEGVRFLGRVRPLARATRGSVISCVGQGMLVACAPLLGEQVFGAAHRGVALLSLVAVSALAANAVLSRATRPVRPDAVVRYSPLVLAVALLLASTGHPALVVAGLLVAGLGEGPQLAALFAVRHRETPAHLRGRVLTTGAALKVTGFALGVAAAGPLGARSPACALLAAAAIQVLATGSYGVPGAVVARAAGLARRREVDPEPRTGLDR
ncbi:MFS transporter [Streptomyces liangshanensis]|uniref:MFS transporter n=1 Tax=Streptomyces liangshanensis TaxID=2717324 RepID=UPI0036D96280